MIVELSNKKIHYFTEIIFKILSLYNINLSKESSLIDVLVSNDKQLINDHLLVYTSYKAIFDDFIIESNNIEGFNIINKNNIISLDKHYEELFVGLVKSLKYMMTDQLVEILNKL